MMQSKQAELDLRGLALVGVAVAWLAGIVLEAWTSLPAFALLMGACTALAWLVPLRRDRLGRLTMVAMLCAALYHLRITLATIIAQSLPQPEASLLIAILLSLHTPALNTFISAFNVTGTAHLVAASGFKVTVLAGLIIASTRWLYEKRMLHSVRLLPAQKSSLNRRRWIASSVVILGITAYTILNGAGPAALRAGIMGILLVVAPRLGRIYNIYTALALAALLMSIFNPSILWFCGVGGPGANFLSGVASRASRYTSVSDRCNSWA